MKLPQHPALPLISVALLGYLCGDVACAVMERQFSGRPQRQQSSQAGGVVPLNGIRSRGELTQLLTARSQVNTTDPTAANTTAAGVAALPGQPPQNTVGNATALPQLAGTLEGQGQSLAVLQMGQETQVVGVGEEWMGFRVIEVGAFQARLRDNRNQEHTISMALANMGSSEPPPAPLAPAGNPFAVTNTNNLMASMDAPYRTSRELRSDLENKGQWVRNILVQPVLRGGENVGVQINYTNTANPFHRLGIQTGDVVLSLNAKPARGVEDITTLLMELRNATTLNFQIERGGQQLPMTVTLEP
jgi:type II secretory pathway component PulC